MNDFKLFDFNYPIADLTWKEEFEKLFIDYFYFYEIGQETIDRFKHTLKVRLNLIMPYYNELYESKLFELSPLLTTKMTESVEELGNYAENKTNTTQATDSRAKTDKTNTTSTGTTSGDSLDQTSKTDYPQHTSIESDIPTERAKMEVLTNATTTSDGETTSTNTDDGESTTTNQGTGSSETTKDIRKIIEGFSGDQNEMLRSYRQNIVNINRLLIEDLKILFILVY